MRSPSTRIVHAPQAPWSHPFFVPMSPSVCRNRSRSDALMSAEVSIGPPLIVKCMAVSPLGQKQRRTGRGLLPGCLIGARVTILDVNGTGLAASSAAKRLFRPATPALANNASMLPLSRFTLLNSRSKSSQLAVSRCTPVMFRTICMKALSGTTCLRPVLNT